jgi:MtrB/PioB family decaheme-associated outer membrane protein
MTTPKNILVLATVLLAIAALGSAQQKDSESRGASLTTVDGTITTGGRQVKNDTNSSKLTEYRDLRNGAFLPDFSLELFDSGKGRFFEFTGTNIVLDHQQLAFRGGRVRQWTIGGSWTGIPHNFSNKAQTPYALNAPGRLEVPTNVPITFKRLATVAGDAANVVASDQVIANYQAAYLRRTSLRTQSDFGNLKMEYGGFEPMKFAVAYDRRTKDGLKPAFGPIGDRPPRTLNIELTEPLDYHTNDVTVSTEHAGRRFQAQFSYTMSDFSNEVDTLLWENVFTTAAPGATFDTWDRSVSTFGRRPLAPDNRSHNVSTSLGFDLPADSRLSGTFAYGRLGQNQSLLPYSYNVNVLANQTLPRATADAMIETKQVLVDYVINPGKVSLRTWARYFGLDNNTPAANWRYVTSDTSNLNGTVAYKNNRVNLAYGTDRFNAGLDASYRIGKSTLSAGYERETIWRDFREADTTEDRITVSWRARAGRRANLRARYLFANRSRDNYNAFVNRQSYWYAPSQANDNDNPQFTFTNHPDMVRYDVADRKRHQGEFNVTFTPGDTISISTGIRYRTDDLDSDVVPIRPLATTGIGEVNALTPGGQLGTLEDAQLRYSVDAFYMAAERLSFNAFLSFDKGTSFQRGLEFDENHKSDPSAVANAVLGPWTRASSRWTADLDDRNLTVGFGTTVGIVPKRVILDASYSISLGKFQLAYGGYGVTSFNGAPFAPNYQFAFSSPPDVNQDLHAVDVGLQFPLVQRLSLALGYRYERFRLQDWQQTAGQLWVEPVGSEFLLRDTSRSHQWGNRLFNLGTLLAPSYDAHIGSIAFTYSF